MKQKLTHRENRLVVLRGGRGRGRDKSVSFGLADTNEYIQNG